MNEPDPTQTVMVGSLALLHQDAVGGGSGVYSCYWHGRLALTGTGNSAPECRHWKSSEFFALLLLSHHGHHAGRQRE